MSNQADSSAVGASPKRQQRASNSSSRLLSYRIPKVEEARLHDVYRQVNNVDSGVNIVDADLMRWCIQCALQKNALQQQLEKVNTAYLTQSDELQKLKTDSQHLSTELQRHILMEETELTRALVNAQQRRKQAGMPFSGSVADFAGYLYTIVRDNVRDAKKELLA